MALQVGNDVADNLFSTVCLLRSDIGLVAIIIKIQLLLNVTCNCGELRRNGLVVAFDFRQARYQDFPFRDCHLRSSDMKLAIDRPKGIPSDAEGQHAGN